VKSLNATESFAESLDHVSSQRRLPPLLRRAWYGLNQAFRRRIAHLDLTPDQFTVLRTLLEGDRRGLTQIELTRRMASDANTIASLVRRMAGARLIRREPDQRDGRAMLLRVRPEGRRKFARAQTVALSLQNEVLRGVPGRDQERFLEVLNRIADSCRAAAESSPQRNGRRRRA
jgi:DNA-binding MarR family transcriptional regulator